MREVFRSQPGVTADYIAVCNPETLADLEAVEARTLIALAVWVDKVRLIDNLYVDLFSLEKDEKERAKKEAARKKTGKTGKKGKKS